MAVRTDAVLEALSGKGLLLKQDKRHPSVVSLVTGESLCTSWWSHSEARRIFKVLSDLADHPEVLFAKLLYGKVTLVHRRLWPAFLGVANANDPWPVAGAVGRRLLALIQKSTDAVRSSGPAVRELEVRLLAHCEEVHTETGRHGIVLLPWQAWSRRAGVRRLAHVDRARKQLEECTLSLGAPLSALPWRSSADLNLQGRNLKPI